MFGAGGESGSPVSVLLSVQSGSGVPPLQHQSASFRQIAAQRVPVVPLSSTQSSLKKGEEYCSSSAPTPFFIYIFFYTRKKWGGKREEERERARKSKKEQEREWEREEESQQDSEGTT